MLHAKSVIFFKSWTREAKALEVTCNITLVKVKSNSLGM